MGKRFEYSEIQANHILDLDARPAHAARPRGARRGAEGARRPRSRSCERILAKRDVLMGVIREELVAIRDAHKAPPPHRRSSPTTRGEIDDGRARRRRAATRHRHRARLRAGGARRAGAARRPPSRGSATRSSQVIETSTLVGRCCSSPTAGARTASTVHDLPKDRLTAAPNLFQLGDGEQIVAVLDARPARRSTSTSCSSPRGRREAHRARRSSSTRRAARDGIVAMKLADDDQVVAVFPGWDDFEMLLVTARRPGHPVRRGRGAPGRARRGRDPRRSG